jgi:molybdopterin molybdotransferase
VSGRPGHGPLTTWADARERAHVAAPTLPAEPVAIADALGGVLAAPLPALVAVPPADCSAMDGYAVCGPAPWTVVAQARAGGDDPPPLQPGTACEIATGATVPEGTSGVLPYEWSERTGATVRGAVEPGRHIRRRGEETAAGEHVLPAGLVLGPAALGLAAGVGHEKLTVRRTPRVATVVTGDEVLDAGVPGAGRVRDAIGPMLPGLVTWAGGGFTGLTRLADSRELLTAALAAGPAEVLMVSGSSSRGPADHLRPALADLGAEMVVDGVACRPGHPQTLARLRGGTLVVGLPGNPLAAFVAFLTLALPVLAGLRGAPLPLLPAGPPLPAHPHDTRLVPVRVREGRIWEVAHAGSAMLRGLATADALAVVAPDGTTVLHPLPGG